MESYNQPPKDKKNNKRNSDTVADQTSRREGRDDALSENTQNDINADEKVIVNEQRSNKAVNAPSQTAANVNRQPEDEI